MCALFPLLEVPLISSQAEQARLTREKASIEQELDQLERKKEELFMDNRRMAEMLATSEGESREVADMLERLAGDKKQLQRQCQQLRESGGLKQTILFFDSPL